MAVLFNVRVYGVLIDHGCILVVDESKDGLEFTKLPGGGLEFGEGTKDCLIREFKEETGLDIEVGAHLYTTDFFQPSAFDFSQQIISIYYYIHCNDLAPLKTVLKTDTPEMKSTSKECFWWLDLNGDSVDQLTLPIDKYVMKRLLGHLIDNASNLGTPYKKYFIQSNPFKVPVPDGKLIEEHFGLASTGHQDLSIAHMIAPPGWSEPHQWPEFDEWTLIVAGKKHIEIDGEGVELEKGQSIWIAKGARVRYSNPFEQPCEYWSICLPAFSVDLVNRE